jgi:hypothetical protein
MHAIGHRRAYSLLEVLAAGTVLTIALVPALEVTRRSLETAREVEAAQHTTTLCISKMEEHLAIVAATFASGTFSGNFSAEGYANIRFSVTRSDTAGNGGIVDRLMVVTVTVWEDANGNSALNTGELSTSLSTKVAKMTVYQDEAS